MALVIRGDRPYFYRSRRVGPRVTSEYVASGDAAILMALLDAEDRAEAEERRRLDRIERQELDDLERALDEAAKEARDAAFVLLRAAGYERHHRGEWRRRRGDRTDAP